MIWIIGIAVALAAYLIGSVNSSILLSRAFFGEDIRKSGSGNAGATNMLRTHGKKVAIATLVIDILKGVAAVLLGVLAEWILSALLAAKFGGQPDNLSILQDFSWCSDTAFRFSSDFAAERALQPAWE